MVRFKQDTIDGKVEDDGEKVTISKAEYEKLLEQASYSKAEYEKLVKQASDEHEKLVKQASYDSLTGLLNKGRFEQLLKHDLTVARRQVKNGGSPDNLVVMYFDLNGLKYVNDTYGHESGDGLLQNAADLIYHFLKRESDTVARIGGDEFAAILPQTDLKNARSIAMVLQEGAKHLGVSVAVGMASYRLSVRDPIKSDKTDEYERLLDDVIHELKDKADTEMYDNKSSIKQKLDVAHFYDQQYGKQNVEKRDLNAVYAA